MKLHLKQALLPLATGLSFSLSPVTLSSVLAGDVPPQIIEQDENSYLIGGKYESQDQYQSQDSYQTKENYESKGSGKNSRRKVISRTRTVGRTSFGLQSQAVRVFNFLNEEQTKKAVFPFDSDEREKWQYRPTPNGFGRMMMSEHKGISLEEMTPDQKLQLSHLLDTALSAEGMEAVSAAVESDESNGSFLSKLVYKYGSDQYYLTFFGSPHHRQWGWRFEGHMIPLNFTVRDGRIDLSPVFIGTTRGQIQLSRGAVAEVLKPVVLSARELMQTMDTAQVKAANMGIHSVPSKLTYAPGVFSSRVKMAKPQKGLPYASLSPSQKTLVREVLESYQAQFENPIRSQNMKRIKANLQDTEFVWAGDISMDRKFYFRIQSPQYVLVFLSEDGREGEYHSVWINL